MSRNSPAVRTELPRDGQRFVCSVIDSLAIHPPIFIFTPHSRFDPFCRPRTIICFKSLIGKNDSSKNARSIDINQIVENIFPIGLCPHFSAASIQPLPPSRN